MSTLTVKQGQHDFKPSIFPWPRFFMNTVLYFEFTLTESCWYDSLDQDNYDFNKAVGLFRYLDFAKNFNAFMLAWRPKLNCTDCKSVLPVDSNGSTGEQFNFELVPYENKNKAILANEDKIRVYKAGDVIKGYFKPTVTGCELYLILGSSVILWHKSNLTTWLYGIVDSWFGGNRYSPQDMEVDLITKHLKLQPHVV